MKAFLTSRRALLTFAAALLGFGITACGDDPVAPDPNLGKTAKVTTFYAQIDENPSKVKFMYNGQAIVDELAYGMPQVASLQIGSNINVKMTGLSGTQLAEASAKVDSLTSTWFVYSGSGTGSEGFAVATTKGASVSGTAGVRMIHASPGAPKVELHQLAANGPMVGEAIEYKRSSSAFTPVLVATPTLVITKEDDSELVVMPVTLEEGKRYTIIVYGNPNSSATANPLTAKLVVEP